MTPAKLKDGQEVACRACWQCRENRVNDLIGRAIVEGETADATFSVTLTYSGHGPETVLLRLSDVQNLMKRLRKAGYLVRYMVAGEFGERRGRPHWHAVLFFRGRVPDVRQERRIDWDFWPHGFSYFQRPDYGGIKYALKYALKSAFDRTADRYFVLSKKPPLGHDWFMALAADFVDRGLVPRDPSYALGAVRDPQGRPRRFWLQGRMRELFFDRFFELWSEKYGSEPVVTDWVMERVQGCDPVFRSPRPFKPLPFNFDPFAVRTGSPACDYLTLEDRRFSIAICEDQSVIVFRGKREWPLVGGNASVENVAALLLSQGCPPSAVSAARLWFEGAPAKAHYRNL